MEKKRCLICAGEKPDLRCSIEQCKEGVFHTKCIEKWHQVNPTSSNICPLCQNQLELQKIDNIYCLCLRRIISFITCGYFYSNHSDYVEDALESGIDDDNPDLVISSCEYTSLVITDISYRYPKLACTCYCLTMLLVLIIICGVVGLLISLSYGGCVTKCTNYNQTIFRWLYMGFLVNMVTTCLITNIYTTIRKLNCRTINPRGCIEMILSKCKRSRVHVQIEV